MFSIPITSAHFHENFEMIFHDTVEYNCDFCKQKLLASMKLEITKLSIYIFVVLNRFSVSDSVVKKR